MNLFQRIRERLRRLRQGEPQIYPGEIEHNTYMFTWDGLCPECGRRNWIEGPKGGAMTNLKCGDCGTWINASYPLLVFEPLNRKDP